MDAAEQPEDLLGMDQSPTKKARAESPSTVRLEHFTCKYDPAWDYKKIAEDMYNGPRYLVMLEKLSTNAHVHFQGETDYAERTFANMRQELAKDHFIKKLKPTSKPVKGKKDPATEKGFQYIMKESAPTPERILAVKGFTQLQLEDLWEKSEEHVQEQKTKIRDYVKDMEIPEAQFHGGPEEHAHLFYNVLMDVDMKLREMDREPTRYTKRDIAHGLRKHKHCSNCMLLWLYTQNLF